MDTGSKAMIRDMNTNFILKTIIESTAVSRADIAKQSGLTKATVSAIVKLLLERRLVAETGIAMTDQRAQTDYSEILPRCRLYIIL